MADLNKVVLTTKQKLIEEIIDKVHSELTKRETKCGRLYQRDLDYVIKEIKKEYKLLPQYDTLEDYIKEHADGGYCKFVFCIDGRQMECCDIGEFVYYYNCDILKDYVVVEDNEESNIHNLTVKFKGENI